MDCGVEIFGRGEDDGGYCAAVEGIGYRESTEGRGCGGGEAAVDVVCKCFWWIRRDSVGGHDEVEGMLKVVVYKGKRFDNFELSLGGGVLRGSPGADQEAIRITERGE